MTKVIKKNRRTMRTFIVDMTYLAESRNFLTTPIIDILDFS